VVGHWTLVVGRFLKLTKISNVKKNAWLILPIGAAVFIGIFVGLLLALTQDLPQVESLQVYEPSAVTTIVSDDGKPIKSLFVERRIPVPMERIPQHLIQAIIAVEDSRFYSHFGLDFIGIARALWTDITTMSMAQGGSTLTQQLAKVLFLTSEKTLVRKLKEAVLAINIERRYSKEEILHMYLNQIYLGEGAYGVEAAARTYFARSVFELNLAESAMIAGLPRSPSTYSPIANPDRALVRMRIVLKRLLDEGYITEAKFQDASAGFFLDLAISAGDPAPYFTELVRQQLEKQISPNLLYRGGLRIETTLNRQMQASATNAMQVGLTAYEKRRSEPIDSDPVQMALLALDPASGEIKALIGGRDFFSSPFNRATQAKRQPGSAFKPILYAAALSSGFTPAEIVSDIPQEIFLPGQSDPWVPVNYSGKYSGPVTIRTALEKSLNAASVDLLMRMGYQPVLDTAQKLGITTALKPYPSLALGTFDVTLKEMVSAYGIFSNGGIHAKPKLIRRVLDREGRMIWESPSHLTDVLSPIVAYQMTNLLEGVVQRGTGRRARALGRPTAGKTGTTDDYRDAWFVGYVPGLVSGVWVGYDLPKTLGEGEAGSIAALPIWIEFMKGALKGIPPSDFPVAQGIELAEVDPATGLIAGPLCPDRVVEAFLPGTLPTQQCSPELEKTLTETSPD